MAITQEQYDACLALIRGGMNTFAATKRVGVVDTTFRRMRERLDADAPEAKKRATYWRPGMAQDAEPDHLVHCTYPTTLIGCLVGDPGRGFSALDRMGGRYQPEREHA